MIIEELRDEIQMQHAAEISAGDVADSKIERAKKQRDYFLQQTSAGAYGIQSVGNELNYSFCSESSVYLI